MREILQEWKDHILETVNRGEAFSEGQPACNGMSSDKTIDMLRIVFATFQSPNETWIFVNSISTAQNRTPASALTSLTSVATTMK